MTQQDIILAHLKSKGSITPMEAINLYGITRLSAVIFDLNKKGHHTIREMKTGINRFERKVRFAEYTLAK